MLNTMTNEARQEGSDVTTAKGKKTDMWIISAIKWSRRRIADRIISTRPQGKVVHPPQSPSGLLQRQ